MPRARSGHDRRLLCYAHGLTRQRTTGIRPHDVEHSVRKSFYLKTFGCQMNVYDSERMAEALARGGMPRPPDSKRADLVILNTCHIREKAAEKVYSDLGRIRAIKEARGRRWQRHGHRRCGLRGAGRRGGDHGAAAGGRSRHRPAELSSFARLIERARHERKSIVETEFPARTRSSPSLPARRRAHRRRRFSPCRKAAISSAVLRRALYARRRILAAGRQDRGRGARTRRAGAREIALLGQNVNAYHGEGAGGRACEPCGFDRGASPTSRGWSGFAT